MVISDWCGIYFLVGLAVFLFFLFKAVSRGYRQSNYHEYELTSRNHGSMFKDE